MASVTSVLTRIFKLLGLEVHRVGGMFSGGGDPLDAVERLLSTTDVKHVFDVGAHKGMMVSRLLSDYPGCVVHAFEADGRSVSHLESKYRSEPSVRVTPKAVSSKSGFIEFYSNSVDSTSSTLPRNAGGRRYYSASAVEKDRIKVESVALDEYILAENIDRVSLLKIDIQGGEIEAFKGARQALAEQVIEVIVTEGYFVEHYEGAPSFFDISELLLANGYTCFGVYNTMWAKNGQMRMCDAVFVSRALRERVIDALPAEP